MLEIYIHMCNMHVYYVSTIQLQYTCGCTCDTFTQMIPMYMHNTHTHSAKNIKVLSFVDVSVSDFNKIHTHTCTHRKPGSSLARQWKRWKEGWNEEARGREARRELSFSPS